MKFYELSETCHRCGIEGQLAHHHMIPGAYRKKCDQYGLVVPLCPRCHDLVHHDNAELLKLRQEAEIIMIRSGWTREQWISEFGKDYLTGPERT